MSKPKNPKRIKFDVYLNVGGEVVQHVVRASSKTEAKDACLKAYSSRQDVNVRRCKTSFSQ